MSEGLTRGGSMLSIFIPTDIAFIRADCQRFWDAMVYKLRRNKHKGRWENIDLKIAMAKLQGEIDELRDAIEDGNSSEIVYEAADVANWALMIANIALEVQHSQVKT